MKTLLTALIILLTLGITNQATADDKPLSGQAKTDSLLAELPNAKGDTNEVNLLNSLSFALKGNNPDKGIEYGNKGLALAKEISWRKGEAKCLRTIGINYVVKNTYDKGFEYLKRALKLSKEIGYKKETAKILGNIGYAYQMTTKYKDAIKYHKKAVEKDEETENWKGVIKHLSNIARVYRKLTEYKKALKYLENALDISKKAGESEYARILSEIGKTYFAAENNEKALEYHEKAVNLGSELNLNEVLSISYSQLSLIHKKLGDLPIALEYQFKVLKIDEEIGNKRWIAWDLNNIGGIYSEIGNSDKAIEFQELALKLAEEMNYKNLMAALYHNIANSIRKDSNKIDKAIKYYENAYKINIEVDNKKFQGNNLHALGLLYIKQKNISKALDYFKRAYNIFKVINNRKGEAGVLQALGFLYRKNTKNSIGIENNTELNLNKQYNLNKSIEMFEKAIDIAIEQNLPMQLYRIYGGLSDTYKEIGDYKNAYRYKVKWAELKDSLFSMDKSKEIANLTAVREKEVAEKELVISQLENAQRKQESYVLYGGLALLALVVIIIFRQRRQSERLLLNILPAKIAKRLKKRKGDIADDIENASTVFIDLVGFTSYSKDKKASDVLKMLNQVFSRIDKLVLKYGLEKIKTIGDGYMAAAGVPEYQEDHSKRAAEFALDVNKELEKFNKENGTDIRARIGIESGAMVAGVIGDMKFIYDLWGDSVNTASRMESTGTPNKVHITENFKLELETHRNDFAFSEPIEIEIKGKGKMKTYYIEEQKVEEAIQSD